MGEDSWSSPRSVSALGARQGSEECCPPARKLFVLGGRLSELRDFIAALDEILAVELLDVGDDRLALLAHHYDSGPLRRDRLLVTAAHDYRAPRELHLKPLAQHGNDFIG